MLSWLPGLSHREPHNDWAWQVCGETCAPNQLNAAFVRKEYAGQTKGCTSLTKHSHFATVGQWGSCHASVRCTVAWLDENWAVAWCPAHAWTGSAYERLPPHWYLKGLHQQQWLTGRKKQTNSNNEWLLDIIKECGSNSTCVCDSDCLWKDDTSFWILWLSCTEKLTTVDRQIFASGNFRALNFCVFLFLPPGKSGKKFSTVYMYISNLHVELTHVKFQDCSSVRTYGKFYLRRVCDKAFQMESYVRR